MHPKYGYSMPFGFAYPTLLGQPDAAWQPDAAGQPMIRSEDNSMQASVPLRTPIRMCEFTQCHTAMRAIHASGRRIVKRTERD